MVTVGETTGGCGDASSTWLFCKRPRYDPALSLDLLACSTLTNNCLEAEEYQCRIGGCIEKSISLEEEDDARSKG